MTKFVDLAGKTILVTGGSRGIGEGIVRGLAHEGANVVLNYTRSEISANKIADEIGRDRCLPVERSADRQAAVPPNFIGNFVSRDLTTCVIEHDVGTLVSESAHNAFTNTT